MQCDDGSEYVYFSKNYKHWKLLCTLWCQYHGALCNRKLRHPFYNSLACRGAQDEPLSCPYTDILLQQLLCTFALQSTSSQLQSSRSRHRSPSSWSIANFTLCVCGLHFKWGCDSKHASSGYNMTNHSLQGNIICIFKECHELPVNCCLNFHSPMKCLSIINLLSNSCRTELTLTALQQSQNSDSPPFQWHIH